MDEERKIQCPICGKTVSRSDAIFTKDCNGIPYRLVCFDCYDEIMDERGYDGEHYEPWEECIEEDY